MLRVREADWGRDGPTLRAIREQVFVHEQKVPPGLEWDGLDPGCLHLVAETADGRAVGTARLLPDGRIGRMAVLAAWRRQGIGRALLEAAIAAARARGLARLTLNAQTYVIRFYERAGFRPEGAVFEEAGIPHQRMRLELAQESPMGIATEEQIRAAVLGETAGEMLLEGRESLRLAALALLRQARDSLELFSWDLEAPVYDGQAFHDAASELARRSRHSRIRILVQSSRRAAQDGHALVRLARRLPSHVEIRKPHKDFEPLRHGFLLADARGMLYRPSPELFEATVDFAAPEAAGDQRAFFDEVWEQSQADTELRRLDL